MFKVGDKVALVEVEDGHVYQAQVCFVGKRVVRVNDEYMERPWDYRFSPKTGMMLDLTGRWPSKDSRGLVFITKQVKPSAIKKWG